MFIYVHGSFKSYTKTVWDLLARRAPSPENERDVTLSECAAFRRTFAFVLGVWGLWLRSTLEATQG